MKIELISVIIGGLVVVPANPALADCVDMSASAAGQSETGMSKDGTHAPLENKDETQAQPGPATGTTTTSSDMAAKSPEKDGSNLPMGESPDLATSGQDAQAQQEGGKSAGAVAQKC